MKSFSSLTFLLTQLILVLFVTSSIGHGVPYIPAARGALRRSFLIPIDTITGMNAPVNQKAFFPAGNRSTVPGAGRRSQIRQMTLGRRNWAPFQPMDPSYNWNYGVCGDPVEPRKSRGDGNPGESLRGGEFYGGGQLVKTYVQGERVNVEFAARVNHGGFMLMHVCDVSMCGGEISEACFKTPGACHAMPRAEVPECESGTSKRCGPIDRANPERWYLACGMVDQSLSGDHVDFGLDGTMAFQLPSNLVCQHCVMHLHWETANWCYPNEYMDYFTGPNKPTWDNCEQENKLKGGLSRSHSNFCGTVNDLEKSVPEEYAYCMDVEILRGEPGAESARPTIAPLETPSPSPMTIPAASRSPLPSPSSSPAARGPSGPVRLRAFYVVNNGRSRVMRPSCVIYIPRNGRITIQARVTSGVNKVSFYINGRLENVATQAPFYIGGTASRPVWTNIGRYLGKRAQLKVVVENTFSGQKREEEMPIFVRR